MGRNAQSAARFHRMRSVHAPYLFGAATQFIPQKGYFYFPRREIKITLKGKFQDASENRLPACTIFG